MNMDPLESVPTRNPTECRYAPPGEYVKDHTLIHHEGWWHLFSISGTEGYFWGYTGNEETFSWSISRDLVNWEFRGHVLHASQRQGCFDQHEVWAPFCIAAQGQFYMFYAGGVFPVRPVEYRKLGTSKELLARIKEKGLTIGVAVSTDLTCWEKVSDPAGGTGIAGRDPHVVRDDEHARWLLYTTGHGAQVAQSQNLLDWQHIGTCARFTKPDPGRNYGRTSEGLFQFGADPMESLTVMKHPLSQKWILMGNWHYSISHSPTDFSRDPGSYYDVRCDGKITDIGFAGETFPWNGKWYRSGVLGPPDHWKLGFTEIEWVPDGAFRIVAPSVMASRE